MLSDENRARWDKGLFSEAHRLLGAHVESSHTRFRVWAPAARAIHVAGDFNEWNRSTHPMKRKQPHGFWECTIPGAQPGDRYKYAITGPSKTTVLKSDPYAFRAEAHAHHASIIYDFPSYSWNDAQWVAQRQEHQRPRNPMSIYEVHPGSWRHNARGRVLNYRQLADQLVPYANEMGFTHIELMPIMEHPFTPSWGYQVTGYFAPTSRYGTPDDFMAFVDACHQNNLGVILDWVPGHFPTDEHGLHFFDGTPLFEHEDKRRRLHPDWGTHNFDFAKAGVRNFLLSNARYWAERYHIDGFRVDAVASMLYLDYSKGEGEWLPNAYGGNENLEAIGFLRDFNSMLRQHHPGVITIAEESTAWPNVTSPADEGGLGFDYKWNMGWMNDTLHYFSQPPAQRKQESHSITFPRTYTFSERFILPFSHDEVVHLKKSLWGKMPGDDQEKFMQLRLMYLYMTGWPGKKLLFMGDEIAETQEWSESGTINWPLLDDTRHQAVQTYVRNLMHLYRSEPVLYQSDHEESLFDWTDLSRKEEGLFGFKRSAGNGGGHLHFLFNFSAGTVSGYLNEAAPSGSTLPLLFDSRLPGGRPERQITVRSPLELKPCQGLVFREPQ